MPVAGYLSTVLEETITNDRTNEMTNPGTEKRQKTESIKVRMAPAEAHEIKKKAESADMMISDFVRDACLRRQIVARTDRETVTQLSKIGCILKRATQKTFDRDRNKEISRVLDQLQGAVHEILNSPGVPTTTVADRIAPEETEPAQMTPGHQDQHRDDTRRNSQTNKSKNQTQTETRTASQNGVDDELDLVGEG